MKNTVVISFFSLAVMIVFTSAVQNPSGQLGFSGSPSETTCANSGCHTSYALNSGAGSVSIASNIPNWEYTPGQTYQITVTPAFTGRTLFGFNTECLDSTKHNFGAIAVGSATDSYTGNVTIGGTLRTGITQKERGQNS